MYMIVWEDMYWLHRYIVMHDVCTPESQPFLFYIDIVILASHTALEIACYVPTRVMLCFPPNEDDFETMHYISLHVHLYCLCESET